jgi:hypothetical protein
VSFTIPTSEDIFALQCSPTIRYMKNAIRDFFLYDRSYQGGISLYMEHGKSQSLQKQLNLQDHNHDLQMILFEELRRMAEIPDPVFNHLMASAVQSMPVVTEEPVSPLPLPEIITPKVKEPVAPPKKANPIKNRSRKKTKQ